MSRFPREEVGAGRKVGVEIAQRALGVGGVAVAFVANALPFQWRDDAEIHMHGLIALGRRISRVGNERAECAGFRKMDLSQPGEVGVGVQRCQKAGRDRLRVAFRTVI